MQESALLRHCNLQALITFTRDSLIRSFLIHPRACISQAHGDAVVSQIMPKSNSWDESQDEIPEEADEDATKKIPRGGVGGSGGGGELGLSEDSEDGDSAGDSAVDSAVLEEDFDPLYEPSPAEIEVLHLFNLMVLECNAYGFRE